jgi:hypothetical protein
MEILVNLLRALSDFRTTPRFRSLQTYRDLAFESKNIISRCRLQAQA